MNIEFVTASRLSAEEFRERSLLWKSAKRFISKSFSTKFRAVTSNTRGLPLIYNEAIEAENDADVLVFAHDDIWIDDFHIAARLKEAMSSYDIIGVAGSRTFAKGSGSWSVGGRDTLFGAVAHGESPVDSHVARWGQPPSAAAALDGLLIAANKHRLRTTGVRFDPKFSFHFYDLDFCLSASEAGLRLGVWPIAVTHKSKGNYDSPEWNAALDVFRRKWSSAETV